MDFYDILRYIAYTIIFGSPVIAGIFIARLRRGEGILSNLEGRDFVVLKILVPKNNEKGPLAAEQMFAALHGILREGLPAQEHISLEVAADGQSIQFYAFMPRHIQDFVESQIYAQYPKVEITEVEDYTQGVEVAPENQVAGTELKLIKEEFFPIKTFPNFEVDPLAGITAVLSKFGPGERIWIQFLLEPADDSWQKKAMDYVKVVKKGLNPNVSLSISPGVIAGAAAGFAAEIVSHVVNGPPKAPEAGAKPASSAAPILSGPEEQGIKGVETKVTKLGFKTLIRIIAFAPNTQSAGSRVLSVVGAFKQFSISNLNGFTNQAIIQDQSIFETYRRRSMSGGYILNTEELASVFHLPHVSVETPAIAWAGSKKGEPPQNLPIEGSTDPNEITLFAETNFRHMNQRFGIKLPDRRYHTYSIGKTGTGKSTLIENMALDDIYKGRGVAVVDPHGDLVKRILERIPSHRINDVVYFNPADREYPIAFNLLENVEQDLKSIVASGLMSIFTKLWANVWSARMEYILRNTILATLDYPDSTLLSVMKILNDPVYRKHVIAKIQDPVIKDFFINEFEKYDPKFRQEAIAPIQNKVGQFLSSSTMRNILGQPQSTIDFEDIMNNGKVLLVNLSIGEIGEDASALLGGMIITKMQLSAMRRAVMPEEQRKDFYLYIDEFQNFATESFAIILSEARKYRLNLFLTNQFIAQMPEAVRDAVFGNVGTMISFRVGPQDGGVLVKEFEPVFESNDLVNLSNYHIYLKMTIDGVTSVPFSAVTLPPTGEAQGNAEKIVRVARERYSRDRDFVEKKITEWSEFWENVAREEARREKERKLASRGLGPYTRGAPTTLSTGAHPSTRAQGAPSNVEGQGRTEQSRSTTFQARAGERPRPSQPAPQPTQSASRSPEPPKPVEPAKSIESAKPVEQVKPVETPKPAPRYIPPPPIRRSDTPVGSSGPAERQDEGEQQQVSRDQIPVSPKMEPDRPGEEPPAKFVEPVEPAPLITAEEVPEHHKKEEIKVPAYGSRSGEVVSLKEGEEIRLDE